jgi:3-hydroxyisobutyrate dehydrogenase-like beta-hydroxyacid dehydrogenase
MTAICLLHPGEMGAAIGANAVKNGHTVLWVPDGRSEATHRRADAAGLTPALSVEDAVAAAVIVLSICPPAAAQDVAEEVSEIGFDGLYVDANAISPEKAIRISELPGLTRVLDGSIIGPPPRNTGTRLYLAGPEQDIVTVADLFSGTLVTTRTAGTDLGSASALKMAFASFQKAARPLAAVAHALARSYNVGDLLADEAATMPGDILANTAYLPSVAARSWRWAPEMEEIANALTSAGLPDDQARAAEYVLHRWDADRDRRDLTLDETLDRLHGDAER